MERSSCLQFKTNSSSYSFQAKKKRKLKVFESNVQHYYSIFRFVSLNSHSKSKRYKKQAIKNFRNSKVKTAYSNNNIVILQNSPFAFIL